MIEPRLWQTYQNVCFCFENENLFDSFAVITAWNPKSIRLSENENYVNNLRLQQAIANYDWNEVRVGDPGFDWFEDSFAVAMPLAAALRLAKEFGQNAIYYVTDGELWLHACASRQAYCLGPLRNKIK